MKNPKKSGLASLMSRYDVPKVMPPQRLPNWFPASIEAWNGEKGADPLREIPNLKMEVKPFINGKTINIVFSNARFSNQLERKFNMM